MAYTVAQRLNKWRTIRDQILDALEGDIGNAPVIEYQIRNRTVRREATTDFYKEVVGIIEQLEALEDRDAGKSARNLARMTRTR